MNERRPTHRSRTARLLVVLLTAGLLTSSAAWAQARRPPPAAATYPSAVANGSAAQDALRWSASSSAGPVSLARSTVDAGNGRPTTAVDLQSTATGATWAFALADLQAPESFLVVGQRYRVSALVRDADASGGEVGLLLANANYEHRPSDDPGVFQGFHDSLWHELQYTFLASAAAGADTAVYLSLPTGAPFHLQVTDVAVTHDPWSAPPRAAAAPSRVVSFPGPRGSAPDPSVWDHELGGGGWGNHELQTYTSSTSNASLDGQGALVVTARGDVSPSGQPRYTSARLITRRGLDVQPGSYVEATLQTPLGAGLWPAFWLIGSDVGEVGWPQAGELDVMEALGGRPGEVQQRVHISSTEDAAVDRPYGGGPEQGLTLFDRQADPVPHRYGVYFDGTMVRFYVDRQLQLAFDARDARASGRSWPFDSPMRIVLNVAVGGQEDPVPTSFPGSMVIQSVTVWDSGTPF